MSGGAKSELAIRRYLDKCAELDTRPLAASSTDAVDLVVVIPVLAESQHLFETLASLAANPREDLERALVLCVVNNRAAPLAAAEDIADNQRVLQRLASAVEGAEAIPGCAGLRVGYVDASSPGKELPPKGGVGAARKIGLDWALAVLVQSNASNGTLLCLDGDTLVEANYLRAVRDHFARPDAWAASIAFAHQVDHDTPERAAILCYELFLRYLRLGLAYAQSPYAFHTIGSAMACTGAAYAAVRGMNTRQAGEDFYFLQQLAKTGRVDSLDTTTVHPSSRGSHRVPFGTGQRVRRYLSSSQEEGLAYNPDTYRVLRDWLALATSRVSEDGEYLVGYATEVAPELAAFLTARGFSVAWDRIRANTRPEHLQAQFHRWFDGFETIKLLHHLRDHGYPETDLFDSLETVLAWNGNAPPFPVTAARHDLDAQEWLLRFLRDLETLG